MATFAPASTSSSRSDNRRQMAHSGPRAIVLESAERGGRRAYRLRRAQISCWDMCWVSRGRVVPLSCVTPDAPRVAPLHAAEETPDRGGRGWRRFGRRIPCKLTPGKAFTRGIHGPRRTALCGTCLRRQRQRQRSSRCHASRQSDYSVQVTERHTAAAACPGALGQVVADVVCGRWVRRVGRDVAMSGPKCDRT